MISLFLMSNTLIYYCRIQPQIMREKWQAEQSETMLERKRRLPEGCTKRQKTGGVGYKHCENIITSNPRIDKKTLSYAKEYTLG